jgi:hypothetical protein
MAGRIRSIEKESNDLFGNCTHKLPDCNKVPQPAILPHASGLESICCLLPQTSFSVWPVGCHHLHTPQYL